MKSEGEVNKKGRDKRGKGSRATGEYASTSIWKRVTTQNAKNQAEGSRNGRLGSRENNRTAIDGKGVPKSNRLAKETM